VRVFLVALGALVFCGEWSDEDDAALKRELRRGFAGTLSSSASFEFVRDARRRVVRLAGDTAGSGGTLSSSPLAPSSNPPGTDVRAVRRDFVGRCRVGGVGGECANKVCSDLAATSRSTRNAPGSGGSVQTLKILPQAWVQVLWEAHRAGLRYPT
jgi:hypothetical protein